MLARSRRRAAFPLTRSTSAAQHNEIDVAVDKACPGRRDRRCAKAMLYAASRPSHGRREIEIGSKAGVVREQIANGDVIFAVLREFRNVFHNRIVEPDLSLALPVA